MAVMKKTNYTYESVERKDLQDGDIVTFRNVYNVIAPMCGVYEKETGWIRRGAAFPSIKLDNNDAIEFISAVRATPVSIIPTQAGLWLAHFDGAPDATLIAVEGLAGAGFVWHRITADKTLHAYIGYSYLKKATGFTPIHLF
jgi:hypothetical protein